MIDGQGTGITIAPHLLFPMEEVCLVMQNGKRVAMLYFHPELRRIQLTFEAGIVEVIVKKRMPGTDAILDVVRVPIP